MARFLTKLLALVALLQLATSCVDFADFKSNERYVVKTKHLYVRNAPTPTSLVLETYAQGDTIMAKPADGKWLMVELDDKTFGFVLISSIVPVDIHKSQRFFVFEKLIDWKSWHFWAVAVVLVILWLLVERASVNFKTHLKTKQAISIKGLLITPVVLFVFGIMSGVLYSNWQEAFVASIQNTFSFSPTNLDVISWVLWVQLLIVLIALLFDLLGAIFKSGVKWGPLLTLVDLFLGIVICVTTFFITTSLYVVGIVLLVIFFASQYTSMVSKNNRRVKLYQRPK